MSKIRLYGETSGFIELSAPDVADDNTVDLSLIPIIEDAPSDGQVLTWNASLSKWEAKDMKMKEKRIEAFTGDGTWTVPAGVTYAIAHMLGGGGGGTGSSTSGSVGGASSVDFASGLVTGPGGNPSGLAFSTANSAGPGQANSGRGARGRERNQEGTDATWVSAGANVTPGENITVVVGAGGAGGASSPAGGSGYVYIEYYEEA